MFGGPSRRRCRHCQLIQRNREAVACGQSHRGYRCTRPTGHPGDHVACGTGPHEHPIETWPALKQVVH